MIKKLFEKKKLILWVIAFAVFSAITFEMMNRPFGVVRNLKIGFDDKIPFIKEMIFTYHSFMPYLILGGLIFLALDEREYKKYVIALFANQLLAYVIFYFFQTQVPRYDTNLLGNDIASEFVKLTYKVDGHFSGFPSLHVANMTTLAIYAWRAKIKMGPKVLMIAYAALVAATTVLVKQHVVMDGFGGLIHAAVIYLIVEAYFNKKKIGETLS